MASAKQQENMLLTEHFTWPPISLIDDIINAVNEVLYRCTDSFETGLLSADPALLGFAERYANEGKVAAKDEDGLEIFPEAKLEIEEGVLKLETLMENAVDKNFDKLEIWTLRNVFSLGAGLGRGDDELVNWVRLGHYENVEAPPKDSSLTPEALYALRRKLIETQKLNAALVAEKNRNEAQLAKLRALLQPDTAQKRELRNSTSPSKPVEGNAAPFSFLTHTPAAQQLGIQPLPSSSTATSSVAPESRTPLTTHTTFMTSQLPHLRQLLASLQPHLATTALPTSANGKESDEVSNERKVYLESQSKRVLERRGVDTKDGVEGVWDSRRVGADEVRGLEGLVGVLGKGRRDVDMGDTGAGTGGGEGGDAMDTS